MFVPLRHHYVPVFYLSRWTGEDGRLCQYSKPNGMVVPNRRYPTQTGFQNRLYEMSDRPSQEAQQIETAFMQPLDTLAADALAMLENDDAAARTDPRYRSAWSRFIISMMLRSPEAIQDLKDGIAADWASALPELEAKYAAARGDADPPTFADYQRQQSNGGTDGWAVSLAPGLIDHQLIGEMINNMRWLVRRIEGDVGEFLTSDRPVIMSATLAEPYAYLFMALGPKTLFAAVNDIETQRMIENRDPAELVEAINTFKAGRAVEYVYSRDDKMLPFVKKHMGTRQKPTLFEQVAAFRARRQASL